MHKSKERIALITSLLLLNTLTISLALALAYYLCVPSGLLPYYGPQDCAVFARTAAMAVPVWLLICAGTRLYVPHLLLAGPQQYAQVVKACTSALSP